MGRLILALALGLGGCLQSAPVDISYPRVQLSTPMIQESSVVCDNQAGRWRLVVDASSWTGGADSAWTVDGVYIELHELTRKSFAGDGSHELLELTLPIVDDWREVTDSSTVFTCSQAPSGTIQLFDRDGSEVDCRSFGPDPSVFEGVPDLAPCDTPVDTELGA